MNSPDRIANLGLTDDEIEAIALKHVAPGAKTLREIVPGLAPYQQSWQFRRIKAFLVDALAARRAPVAGEAQGWIGWACQYPNKLPRLYGAKEIAHLNCDAANGDRVLFLSEHAAPQASEAVPLLARALAEWHEDDGPVTWWAWCGHEWAGEAPWCGTPLDQDWPGYHTHWTPIPGVPAALSATQAEQGERDA